MSFAFLPVSATHAGAPFILPESRCMNIRRIATVAAVYLGTFVSLLDVSIVNVALPAMQRDLAADLAGLQWVVDAYTLCLSAFMLSAGAVGDRYGRKLSWIVGVGVFTVGSGICAVAPDLSVLLAGRFVQGVAGALLIPGALSILMQTFDNPRARANAIGGWSSFAAISLIIGPVLGGVLVDVAGWQSIFLINLPLGLITVLLGAWSIKESSNPDHAALDPAGQALSILWLGALTYGLIAAGEHGWAAVSTLIPLALGIVGLIIFLKVEGRVARPLLPLSIFRQRGFAVANVVSFVLGFSSYSSVFFFSLFLQFVQGWSPTDAGLRMAPQFVAQALVAPMSGRLAALFGARRVMIVGYMLLGAGTLAMSLMTATTPFLVFGMLQLVTGMGIGLAIPTTSAVAMELAPRERSGMAAAVVNAIRQTGTAIGIALLGAVMSLRAIDLLTDRLESEGVTDAGAAALAAVVRHDFTAARDVAPDLAHAYFIDAFAGGFSAAMLAAGLAAVAAAVTLMLLMPRER